MGETYVLKLEAINDIGEFICPEGSSVPYKLQKGFGEQYSKGNFISLLNYAISPDIDEHNPGGLSDDEKGLVDKIKDVLNNPEEDIVLYVKKNDGNRENVAVTDKVGNYVESKVGQLSSGSQNYKGLDLIIEATDGGG